MLKRRIVAALAIGIVAVGMFPQLEPNNRRNNIFWRMGRHDRSSETRSHE